MLMRLVSQLNGPLLQGELLDQTSFRQWKDGRWSRCHLLMTHLLAVPAVTSRWGTSLSQAALRQCYAPEPISPGLTVPFSAGVRPFRKPLHPISPTSGLHRGRVSPPGRRSRTCNWITSPHGPLQGLQDLVSARVTCGLARSPQWVKGSAFLHGTSLKGPQSIPHLVNHQPASYHRSHTGQGHLLSGKPRPRGVLSPSNALLIRSRLHRQLSKH